MKLKGWVGVAFLTTSAVAAVVSCVGDTPAVTNDGGMDAGPGSLGQPCFGNGTCDPGLTCISNVCVDLSGKDGATDSPADQATGDATDASDAATTVYSTFNDTSKWSTYDLKNVIPNVNDFQGGVFDGRYIYLVPNSSSSAVVARYDTTTTFDTVGSWSTFDLNGVTDAGYPRFSGATFDGRYVYFVPNLSGLNGNPSGVTIRYDTQASFNALSSWSSFDIAKVYNSGAAGFRGGTFDGQYVYFVPNENKYNVFDGILARYNTQTAFDDASASWQTFDLTTISDAGAIDFLGAVYDGRYVYLVPNRSTPGVAVRYDTQSPWTGTSFTTFDLSTFTDAGAGGFIGGAFDGRYVYFSPNYAGGTSGFVSRYDTQAPFNAPSSWTPFDMTTAHGGLQGFQGAAFDGRYVYFVPSQSNLGLSGLIGRYDTQAPFTAIGSWTAFDTKTLSDAALVAGFFGAIFDGRYLYFVPSNGSVMARFDAKTPPALPAGYAHGSFY